MNAVEHFHNLGIHLWLSGDELRYRGPKEVLTTSVINELRALKPAITNLLRARDSVEFWISRAQSDTTIPDLTTTLTEFHLRNFSLLDKARMSAGYTPRLLQLIKQEDASKWQIIETLADLCWNKPSQEPRDDGSDDPSK